MAAVDRLSKWLEAELAALPAKIRAVYVEFSEAYAADMKQTTIFDAFGFEGVPDDYGEFCWESKESCSFEPAELPDQARFKTLQKAMNSAGVKAVADTRNLFLACAEHDGEIKVVRKLKLPGTG